MAKRRTYAVQRYYAVICSECNEDITEDRPRTPAEAEEERAVHEAWHRRDEGVGPPA